MTVTWRKRKLNIGREARPSYFIAFSVKTSNRLRIAVHFLSSGSPYMAATGPEEFPGNVFSPYRGCLLFFCSFTHRLFFPVCCVTLFAVTAPPGAAFKTFRSSCGSSLLLSVASTALCYLYLLLSLSNSSNSGIRKAYFKMVQMRIIWSLGCLESS